MNQPGLPVWCTVVVVSSLLEAKGKKKKRFRRKALIFQRENDKNSASVISELKLRLLHTKGRARTVLCSRKISPILTT